MVAIVQGEPGTGRSMDFSTTDHGYEYPGGLDLKPGSEFHTELRDKIWRRANESHTEMSNRFNSWNEVDRLLTTYIPLKDKEIEIKEKDSTKPVSVVFPYTYSMLEALLTYLSLAFFQDPIFQYEGYTSEDTKGAMLLELVIKLHCIKAKVPLAIHTVLRDCLAYGIGVGAPSWEVRMGKRFIKSTSTIQGDLTGEQITNEKHMVEDIVFEGNRLDNIDPYLWLPDTSVSVDKIQSGEYVGWVVKDNIINLLSDESLSEGRMFNVKYLKEYKGYRSSLSEDKSDRHRKTGGSSTPVDSSVTNPVDIIYMYVNLVPKDWKLGKGEVPEKWLFALGADQVIIQAMKSEHAHGMYPVAVASPEFDGYSATPISRLEILYGLQGVLDWMFNSHVANVRKSLNDMFVVDPYLVNINDIKDPKPGKLIRLRKPGWGKGVDKAVQQLAVNDITRQNIGDSAYITGWMDRISGADQSMSGSLRQSGPERLTGAEFQGTRGSAISRLQRLAMIISYQFMQDMGHFFAVHAQQYMTKETYVKVVGRNQEKLEGIFGAGESAKVTPFDLAIDYDIIVRDGSVPGGNFSDAWIQLFQIIGSSEELTKEFDITRIFTHIATQLGAKNVEDFKRNVNRIQPTTMPDEEVMREAERGNLVPTGV